MISHLFFADDNLFFFQNKKSEGEALKRILRSYEEASGQQVSLAKSELSFSGNVEEEEKQEMVGILGMKTVMQHDKYLGLPTLIGRAKKAVSHN
ncbi:unnamed protein product [Linum trigynum]|uniref:Reverse transcriptase n=1 Tax=Linum trigynum TaxID=586398 RepID=A0AAV2EE21_9ROSI